MANKVHVDRIARMLQMQTAGITATLRQKKTSYTSVKPITQTEKTGAAQYSNWLGYIQYISKLYN
jgi:hypothetical protein